MSIQNDHIRSSEIDKSVMICFFKSKSCALTHCRWQWRLVSGDADHIWKSVR